MIFTCTIPGRNYVKKNTQRVVGFGKSKRVIYSKNYLSWENIAIPSMRRSHAGPTINDKVNLCVRFYFKDRQAEPDLSALFEGVADCLQKAAVISNDRNIYSFNGSTKIFGETPRTEIELTVLVEL